MVTRGPDHGPGGLHLVLHHLVHTLQHSPRRKSDVRELFPCTECRSLLLPCTLDTVMIEVELIINFGELLSVLLIHALTLLPSLPELRLMYQTTLFSAN